jgi:hypothetical protein
MRRTLIVLILVAVRLITGCSTDSPKPTYSTHRGVHSGMRERVDYFYSLQPSCEISGYPEVKVVRAPKSGDVSIEKGEDYPTFPKGNVRWDCDRALAGSTRVFYQSKPGFHGNDTFSIEVRFPDARIETVRFLVDVW